MSLINSKCFAIFLAILFSISYSLTSNFLFVILNILIVLISFIVKNYKIAFSIILVFLAFQVVPLTQERKTEELSHYDLRVVEAKTNYYITEGHNNRFLLYSTIELKTGNGIRVEGKIEELRKNGIPNIFDFSEYLKSKKVFYQIIPTRIDVIDDRVSFSTGIKESILLGLSDYSKAFVQMFLFNEKEAEVEEMYNDLYELSAIHLFAISGMHINLLIGIIVAILTKLFSKKRNYRLIGLAIIFPYLIILSFTVSSLRAFLTILYKEINKKFDIGFTQIDIISLVGITLMLVNPLSILSLSFIYSFTLVFAIEFTRGIINKQPKILRPVVLSFVCFLTIIPITLIVNSELNIISVFTNIILTPVMSISYVFSFILAFFHQLDFLGNSIYSLLEIFINQLNVFSFPIVFGKFSIALAVIYYIVFIIVIDHNKIKIDQKKQVAFILGISLVIYSNSNVFIPHYLVHFIDVGQGSCTLIQDKLSMNSILIDTGGLSYLDLANDRLIPYFKSINVKKINLLILTHDDFDHTGAAESLKEYYKVDKTISSPDFDNVSIGNIKLFNLNRSKNNEENDDSIVLFTKLNNKKYIFTGDIGIKKEEEIIKNNKELDIDVLQVAHHGSNSSTSLAFLEATSPETAIISCGRNNIYKHPSDVILNRLASLNVNVFRTDIHGTIILRS